LFSINDNNYVAVSSIVFGERECVKGTQVGFEFCQTKTIGLRS